VVIQRSGFTLSLRKARWARSEVKFLGHVIGCGNRRANSDKVEAIMSLRVPETKRQVRQVLGFFEHFQDYIAEFA
jgi:hypothetical protein